MLKKYLTHTLSPVEEDYLKTINGVNKLAKKAKFKDECKFKKFANPTGDKE